MHLSHYIEGLNRMVVDVVFPLAKFMSDEIVFVVHRRYRKSSWCTDAPGRTEIRGNVFDCDGSNHYWFAQFDSQVPSCSVEGPTVSWRSVVFYRSSWLIMEMHH